MKLVAVVSMRNEVDIIESWARYYARMVDHIIITDNKSIDGSGELVQKLIDEGLPISLETDNRLGHFQAERMQKMMHQALSEFQADWVLLLDSDEFIIPSAGKSLYDIFSEVKNDQPLNLPWKTYIPTESDPEELNVLKRIAHRLEKEVDQYYKVMIPARIGEDPNTIIMRGNHCVRMGQKMMNAQVAPSGTFLAHFPIRSMGQITTKIMVGWLTTVIKPDYVKKEGFHWKLLYDSFVESNGKPFDELENMAINYLGVAAHGHKPRVINSPIDKALSDFSIRYFSEVQYQPFTIFAKTAEDIAYDLGRLAAQTQETNLIL